MTPSLTKFKKILESECAIVEWSPSIEQLLKIAFDVNKKGEHLSRGDLYDILKNNYKDKLYFTVKKGLNFQKMINLLEIILSAAEVTKDDNK